MKRIENKFNWYPRDFWHWPDNDEKLKLVNDWVDDVELIMNHVPHWQRLFCVQAGGAAGIWPVAFSRYFQRVVTFEPNENNYECLILNALPLPGVKIGTWNAALGKRNGRGELKLPSSESSNAGAYYVDRDAPSSRANVDILALDDLQIPDVGLIQLDVEGGEYDAIVGAAKTIKRYKPVIVIEEKPLPQFPDSDHHLKARKMLEAWGYRERAAFHRDVVFVHD